MWAAPRTHPPPTLLLLSPPGWIKKNVIKLPPGAVSQSLKLAVSKFLLTKKSLVLGWSLPGVRRDEVPTNIFRSPLLEFFLCLALPDFSLPRITLGPFPRSPIGKAPFSRFLDFFSWWRFRRGTRPSYHGVDLLRNHNPLFHEMFRCLGEISSSIGPMWPFLPRFTTRVSCFLGLFTIPFGVGFFVLLCSCHLPYDNANPNILGALPDSPSHVTFRPEDSSGALVTPRSIVSFW